MSRSDTIPPEDRDLVSIDAARRRMLSLVQRLDGEVASVLAARGQALDEDVTSDVDLPPFDASAMDGYAVRAADLAGATPDRPQRLRVVAHLPAGHVDAPSLGSGEAARIMTGAPLPPGADAVVIVEETDGGTDTVAIRTAARRGAHVRRRGESVRRGVVALARGTRIRPPEQALLAAVGRREVRVVRRPRVAIVTTGDELCPPEARPGPGQIRDANRWGLHGQLEALGAVPLDLGLVPDDAARLRRVIRDAVERADAVITTGGVSVGDYDLTREILRELGEIHVWRIAMKPGKPQAFGTIAGKPVFGLPGNPVSSLIVFDQLVRLALLAMAGLPPVGRRRHRAVLDQPLAKAASRTHVLGAWIEERDGVLHARPSGPQGSGNLLALTRANGLMILGRAVRVLEPGAEVEVELWD
ncbi:MAG: molybdopterin molybdotransferase MoeA [Candidatus Eiseniibacteriota bacterium]|jgi:molybdopterin molybdotransferase